MSKDKVTGAHPKYRKPPVEHQFKAGQSGNPRGRPIKQERSLTSLQVLRDTFAVTNAKIRVRSAEGSREITVYQALLKKAAQRGLEGHGPMLRFSIERHEDAVREHEQRYSECFPMLDQLETRMVLYPPDKENRKGSEERLNEWRKDTQRT